MDQPAKSEITIPDTLITLIVCFVIAMTFRGFVLEGFVIPTGSMAPTLLGDHAMWRSPVTGYSFTTDTGERFLNQRARGREFEIADPMLDRDRAILAAAPEEVHAITRSGDRVLVMKWFYAFVNPSRYDVMVFKNPTRSWENYIKRVVGLPEEEIWLADGDVFVRPVDDSAARFEIARKPLHVQRAVWQPVFDSAFLPRPGTSSASAPRAPESRSPSFTDPWIGGLRSEINARAYRIDGANATTMTWDNRIRPLDDWNAYNMFGSHLDPPLPVSDLRVMAALAPDEAGVQAAMRLRTRGHSFEFRIEGERATVRITPLDDPDRAIVERSEEISAIPAGRTTVVEFWHVDQSLQIFIDGARIIGAEYDWDAWERLNHATGRDVRALLATSRAMNPLATQALPGEPALELSFSGAPVTITHLQVDRDIYYRPVDGLDSVGTHPDRTARLNEDQFFMLGDNSNASADSRLWGEPDELVAAQVDPAPFIVNRRLIIGKAWSVYFPSPYPLVEGGRRFIPDFGRIRFIR